MRVCPLSKSYATVPWQRGWCLAHLAHLQGSARPSRAKRASKLAFGFGALCLECLHTLVLGVSPYGFTPDFTPTR